MSTQDLLQELPKLDHNPLANKLKPLKLSINDQMEQKKKGFLEECNKG